MKNNVIMNNFVWKFGERISAQLVTFIVSIILARILSPNDYGAIAILNVFITIANVFVVNGFSSALIQKKKADNLDFSSVFYFSLFFSILIYIILFIASPFIANWYNMPVLSPTLRVLSIRVIIAAVNSVQEAYISRKMIFKKFFWATLGGTITSAFVGIIMAYMGFGVWALVFQYLTNTTIDTIVLWITVKWRPSREFSFLRLKELLSFGWKCLASAMAGAIYDDLRTLIIGKRYSNSDLAYYSKGQQFPQLIMNNINNSISAVLFPALSKLQDEKEHLREVTVLTVQVTSSIIVPLMFGLAAVGDNLIKILLTDKWLPSLPFLKIACIFYLITAIYTAYLQTYKALGRSGLALILELIDSLFGILLIILVYNSGVLSVAIVTIFSRGIAFMACFYFNKKLLNMDIGSQILDISKPILLSIIMYIVITVVDSLEINTLFLLIIEIIVGVMVYMLGAFVIKLPLLKIIKDYFVKRKGLNKL